MNGPSAFQHYLLYASYSPYVVSRPVNQYEKMGAQFYAGHYYMYRGCFIVFAVLLFSLQLYMDFSS